MSDAIVKVAVLSQEEFLDAIFASKPDTTTGTYKKHLKKISETTGRNHHVESVFGRNLDMRLQNSRVLMVGAGGIGCELLKDLLLSNFGHVTIVDLDTIDLSNLNRQFLFRHEHIKQSKAMTAKIVAQKFNPKAEIIAYHGDIKDNMFNLSWFADFDLVFNALDNLSSRRYVNRMCLMANIPLIESGTTGFKGQVQVIKKGVTACYDCTPKETPKTFPVCTIRSTPSQPIHCIVWAKSYLLNEIFGASEDESAFDHSQDTENAAEIEELRRESRALKEIRARITEPTAFELLFNKVFRTDILRLLAIEEIWRGKRKPIPVAFADVRVGAEPLVGVIENNDGQALWSLEQNVAMLMASTIALSSRVKEMRANNPGELDTITFDKDDIDTLNFVTAASNIRATIFGIENKSRFDVKQMAGNIIPAIATTNAITSGLVVLQAYQVLQNKLGKSKEVFLTPFAPDRLLAPNNAREPIKDCPICSPVTLLLKVNEKMSTLGDLVEFLKGLGYTDEFVVTADGALLYDVDEDVNLPRTLKELGIESQGFLSVKDEQDESPKQDVSICIQYLPNCPKKINWLYESRITDIPLKPMRDNKAEADDDDIVIPESGAGPSGMKRAYSEDGEGAGESEAKKARKEEKGKGAEVVEEEGLIVLD